MRRLSVRLNHRFVKGRSAGVLPAFPDRARLRVQRALGAALILLWIAIQQLSAATLTATLESDTVSVGDQIMLTIQVEGGQPKAFPQPPQIANLQFVFRGESQNFSFVNGKMSSTVAHQYALRAAQPGDYVIPALTAEVDGQTVSSAPLKLKVKAQDTSDAGRATQLAFLKLNVLKSEPSASERSDPRVPWKRDGLFVGEVATVELELYIQAGVLDVGDILQRFEELAGTLVRMDGLSVLKTATSRRGTRIGDAAFAVGTFRAAVSPVKPGNASVSTTNFALALRIPTGQRGFFQQVQIREVAIPAVSETLWASPVPRENAPPDFTGAVGEFRLNVEAGPTEVAAGDPVTMKIQLSGRGALESLAPPTLQAQPGLKVYPPTAKVDLTDPLGTEGTKTFEAIVVLEDTTVRELPEVSFSFFDPDRRRYQTLKHPAIPVTVRPGNVVATPVIAASGARTEAPPATQDIVPIKQRLGSVAQISPPLVRQSWFLALQSLPVIALLAAMAWRKHRDRMANNPRLRRQKQVAQLIREGLGELRKFAAENRSDDFFATLFRLLQEQLGERLNVPASAITEAVIEEQLRPRKVPEETLAALHELFQACNLARYAPVKSSQELAAIIPRVEGVLGQLREVQA